MYEDKRKGSKPIPLNVKKYLNEDQQVELRTIEGFGWDLKFIRRPLFQEPVVVVMSPDGHSIGTLEEDGRLNLDADINIRNPI